MGFAGKRMLLISVDFLRARAEMDSVPSLTRVQHTLPAENALKHLGVDGAQMLSTVAYAFQTQGRRHSVLQLEHVTRG